MKNKKASGKNFLSLFLALVLLIGAGVGSYFLFFKGSDTAQSVMEVNVNPNVQFVLNEKDRVVAVNYLNTDAEVLLKEVSFEGKKADDAAKLFIQLSTEAGYIDVETTGTRVDIKITGKAEADFTALKNSVVNKVNSYFDENGIIAGAIAEVNSNLHETVQNLRIQSSYLLGKTDEEILKILTQTSKDLEGIAYSVQTTIINQYNTLIAQLDEYMEQLNNYMETINNSDATELQKITAQGLYDALKITYDSAKQLLDNAIETAKASSQAVFQAAKTTLATAKAEAKAALDSHIKASQSAIDAYREILENNGD